MKHKHTQTAKSHDWLNQFGWNKYGHAAKVTTNTPIYINEVLSYQFIHKKIIALTFGTTLYSPTKSMERVHCTAQSQVLEKFVSQSIISVNSFYIYWVCVKHPHGVHSDHSSRRTEVTWGPCVLRPAPCATLPGSWLQWHNGTSGSLCRGIGDVCDIITPRYVHFVAQHIFTDTRHRCGLGSVPSLAGTVNVESSGCGLWISSLRPAATSVNCMK